MLKNDIGRCILNTLANGELLNKAGLNLFLENYKYSKMSLYEIIESDLCAEVSGCLAVKLSNEIISQLEKCIMLTNDAEIMYKFVKNYTGLRIIDMFEAIIKTNSKMHILALISLSPEYIVRKIEKYVLESGDADFIYSLAKRMEKPNYSAIEKALIDIDDLKYLLRFADMLDKCSKNLVDAILKKDIDLSLKWTYLDFCQKLPKSYKEKLIEKIVESKNVNIIIEFVQSNKVSNALMDKIVDVICKYGYQEDITSFVKNVKIQKRHAILLQNVLLAKKDVEARYIIWFAQYAPNANITALENWIIQNGDRREIYEFAKEVKGIHVNKLANALVEKHLFISDAYTLIAFALNIPYTPIKKFEDLLIRKERILGIIEFTEAVPNANIPRLAKSVMRLGTDEDIYDFCKKVKRAPISEMVKKIEKSCKDAELMRKFLKLPNLPEENAYNLLTKLIKLTNTPYAIGEILREYGDKFPNIVDTLINRLLCEGNFYDMEHLLQYLCFRRDKDVYEKYIDIVIDRYIEIGNENKDEINIINVKSTILPYLNSYERKEKILKLYISM